MKTRRGFSAEFKAKVALEAIRGERTISELATKHQLGVSQTLLEAAITQPRPVFSCFVNLLQSEEARKQIILVIDGPAA